ncbi:GntP family permease [Dactylosporangium matsuzakiense]|uniref:Gluconate permease n=1 Tax=Dactylosporangium matsuzakiense TaxID=53360 RepID=A0A9W6KUC3_9ACTN|nr:GntP family permease [Dactylosporangium matsuzakiense]UWZ46967.1 gluconate:H+ symporter [Dactylosporangium matsuzakiense]GLL06859.1 gluconate permease [Dactylosporangium matsuzakiense]
MHWTLHDTTLVIWTAVAIAVVVVLITRYKIHPFLALILGSAVVGLGAGLGATKSISSFESGFGTTLGGVGILVALGTILGKLLADSGGADQVVDTIVGRAGPARLPWAMALIAMIIGIPLFFEVGVVLLIPVIFLVARRAQSSIVRVGIPALAGLSVMHGLVPPHPGPLIAINALHADLGQTLAFGLLVAIPTVIIAGPLYGIWIARFVSPAPPARLVAEFEGARARTATEAAGDGAPAEGEGQGEGKDQGEHQTTRPGFVLTLVTVLLPVVLMLGKAIADIVTDDKNNLVRKVFDSIGDPFVALLLAVLLALFTFGYLRGFSRTTVSDMVAGSLLPIAGIVFIIGAGGGFKQVLVAIGIGDAIGKAAAASGISALLLGWLIAVGIRLATGSATVATVTAAGLMAPLLAQLPGTNTALLALAIGSGSLFLSHVNDAGFWLVKEYFGMTVGETFKTWSAMETIISVVSIALILLLGVFV